MKILGLNISITRNQNSKFKNQKSLTPSAWLHADDPDPRHPTLSSPYEQVVWVYRAINALAELVANIPFLFSSGERGRENLITSGPLHDFYNRPHPQINRFQYWELRVLWLMLRGECFRIPIYGDAPRHRRSLRSILMLNPDSFQPVIQNNDLAGWRYTGLGNRAPLESQIFLPEEVWFEK